MNKIFKGERLTISGQLKLNGAVVPAPDSAEDRLYDVKIQIYAGNCTHLDKEVTMTYVLLTNKYTYELDTSAYNGALRFRFKVVNRSDSSITIANNEISRTICE